LTSEDVAGVVMANSGAIKDKQVDPRKLIGVIHIKKYIADVKINGTVEKWISIVKKLTPAEGEQAVELTEDEVVALEECKVRVKSYLDEEASNALKTKIAESKDEMKNLKDVSSSMKFKFSKNAYEAITHVINLMTRELLVFTCDSCASQRAKLTKVVHIPWDQLKDKQMAGLYLNTKAAFDCMNPVEEEEEEEEVVEDVPVDEVVEVVDEAAQVEPEVVEETVEEVKSPKPRLSQYISNTFKEIVSRDPRFKGLLLGKEVTALVNDIIYQTLDRFANIIKSLLDMANSKTVSGRLAIIAVKILLQDHIHTTNEDIAVVLDVVQARLSALKEQPEEEQEPAATE